MIRAALCLWFDVCHRVVIVWVYLYGHCFWWKRINNRNCKNLLFCENVNAALPVSAKCFLFQFFTNCEGRTILCLEICLNELWCDGYLPAVVALTELWGSGMWPSLQFVIHSIQFSDDERSRVTHAIKATTSSAQNKIIWWLRDVFRNLNVLVVFLLFLNKF